MFLYRLNVSAIFLPTNATFLTSSQLTKIIHWPCCCTVPAYIAIHFCGSMWSLWVEAGLCRVFFIICLLFIFVKACGLYEWKRGCAGFFSSFVCYSFLWKHVVFISRSEAVQVFYIICLYLYCRWRSNYQEEWVGMFVCPNQGLEFPTSYVVGFYCIHWVLIIFIIHHVLSATFSF